MFLTLSNMPGSGSTHHRVYGCERNRNLLATDTLYRLIEARDTRALASSMTSGHAGLIEGHKFNLGRCNHTQMGSLWIRRI